jgi:hypothetical protein
MAVLFARTGFGRGYGAVREADELVGESHVENVEDLVLLRLASYHFAGRTDAPRDGENVLVPHKLLLRGRRRPGVFHPSVIKPARIKLPTVASEERGLEEIDHLLTFVS